MSDQLGPIFDGYDQYPEIRRDGDSYVYKVWGLVGISDEVSSGPRAEEVIRRECEVLGRAFADALIEMRLVK